MTRQIIQPRTLPGFRDFLPDAMIPREKLMETARRVFRSWGFSPIDTPALEFLEILTGKGSEETDRQMYHFVDNGDRHVGMRFDLTVPLARYVAQHGEALGMPFRRYHIGPVWRGERPQAGRYREFVQSDFDTIGSTSVASDAETALVIHDLLRAIGFERFRIRINSRQLLNGVLDQAGLAEQAAAVLRSIDKLEKAGRDKVVGELQRIDIPEATIESLLAMVSLSGSNTDVLKQLEAIAGDSEAAHEGIARLRDMLAIIEASGACLNNFQIDPSIARGLDYYTGVVFETILEDDPSIGSVCSGGRYNDLAGLYTKRQLPGIGASLGLDRLLAAMERLEMIPAVKTPADLLIINFGDEFQGRYQRLARDVRLAGFGVEVYPDAKKLGQQFKYADQRGFAVCLIAGADEFQEERVRLKWMESGTQVDVAMDEQGAELASVLSETLGRSGAG